jgi:nitrite reductase/ring-hydroxylating ferredoxin subunit
MLERMANPLAGLSRAIAKATNAVYRALGSPGKLLQDLLNGSWLGHALHPILVDVVIGGSTAAVLLLVLGWFGVQGLGTALAWVLALVCLSALAAIVSGLTDFKDTAGAEQTLAGMHGVVNIVGTIGLLVAFFAALGEAETLLAVSLLAGYAVLSFGAFVGGHVVFKYGAMVNHNAFPRSTRAKEFTAVMPLAQLAEATPTKAMLGPTALVVVRRGDVVHALRETCSHAAGPLSAGELRGDSIVCPWHGSTFELRDGSVRHGPATTRQVAYEARINGDQVEVKGPIA